MATFIKSNLFTNLLFISKFPLFTTYFPEITLEKNIWSVLTIDRKFGRISLLGPIKELIWWANLRPQSEKIFFKGRKDAEHLTYYVFPPKNVNYRTSQSIRHTKLFFYSQLPSKKSNLVIFLPSRRIFQPQWPESKPCDVNSLFFF
jgi:hypothetical protein